MSRTSPDSRSLAVTVFLSQAACMYIIIVKVVHVLVLVKIRHLKFILLYIDGWKWSFVWH